jgi:hypothetical protein
MGYPDRVVPWVVPGEDAGETAAGNTTDVLDAEWICGPRASSEGMNRQAKACVRTGCDAVFV